MFCWLIDSTITNVYKNLTNYTHSIPLTFRDSWILVFRKEAPIRACAPSQT